MAENKGNKNIVRDNHGTINITNSHDSELLKKMIRQNESFNLMANQFTKTIEKIANETIKQINKKKHKK